jgi:hypothetical protein
MQRLRAGALCLSRQPLFEHLKLKTTSPSMKCNPWYHFMFSQGCSPENLSTKPYVKCLGEGVRRLSNLSITWCSTSDLQIGLYGVCHGEKDHPNGLHFLVGKTRGVKAVGRERAGDELTRDSRSSDASSLMTSVTKNI